MHTVHLSVHLVINTFSSLCTLIASHLALSHKHTLHVLSPVVVLTLLLLLMMMVMTTVVMVITMPVVGASSHLLSYLNLVASQANQSSHTVGNGGSEASASTRRGGCAGGGPSCCRLAAAVDFWLFHVSSPGTDSTNSDSERWGERSGDVGRSYIADGRSATGRTTVTRSTQSVGRVSFGGADARRGEAIWALPHAYEIFLMGHGGGRGEGKERSMDPRECYLVNVMMIEREARERDRERIHT